MPGESNDFSVCITCGLIGQSIDVLHVHREQHLYPELLAAALKLRSEWAPNLIIVEKAVTGFSLKPDLVNAGAREAFWLTPEKGKVPRMVAQSAKIERGEVRIPKTAHWLEGLKAEIKAFPNGTCDDQ